MQASYMRLMSFWHFLIFRNPSCKLVLLQESKVFREIWIWQAWDKALSIENKVSCSKTSCR